METFAVWTISGGADLDAVRARRLCPPKRPGCQKPETPGVARSWSQTTRVTNLSVRSASATRIGLTSGWPRPAVASALDQLVDSLAASAKQSTPQNEATRMGMSRANPNGHCSFRGSSSQKNSQNAGQENPQIAAFSAGTRPRRQRRAVLIDGGASCRNVKPAVRPTGRRAAKQARD
jgi:hypothetical protein